MNNGVPDRVSQAFAAHEAFEEREGAFAATTARFDTRILVVDRDESASRYRLSLTVPTLSSAVEGPVADVVEEGWLDTFRLRLEDAAMAVPTDSGIEVPTANVDNGDIVVETTFRESDPERAPRTAKALINYVEGTYAEGVVPGYEYRPPVSDLLASARHDDSDTDPGGPMPL